MTPTGGPAQATRCTWYSHLHPIQGYRIYGTNASWTWLSAEDAYRVAEQLANLLDADMEEHRDRTTD